MAEKASSNVNPSSSLPSTAKSPDSDVSPTSQVVFRTTDYFTTGPVTNRDSPKLVVPTSVAKVDVGQRRDAAPPSATNSTAPSTTTSASIGGEDGTTDSRRPSHNGEYLDLGHALSRKSSSASVSFRAPRNPSLPQGLPRKTDNQRLRESSPSPIRYVGTFKFVGVDGAGIYGALPCVSLPNIHTSPTQPKWCFCCRDSSWSIPNAYPCVCLRKGGGRVREGSRLLWPVPLCHIRGPIWEEASQVVVISEFDAKSPGRGPLSVAATVHSGASQTEPHSVATLPLPSLPCRLARMPPWRSPSPRGGRSSCARSGCMIWTKRLPCSG
ncbi:hypothetical protein B0H67DRAFT_287361 [Lasiosphaeris hirsuta]|uniref:Uncharacterized protein n=1 Tax=Lasiosphaeris hirsuta TaxID=260670 RepID=A0AA40A8Q5_9PEZI|nr:hypothetical protein B0H67DRAFT_287361 [Lasiosphaeris hirsuta]